MTVEFFVSLSHILPLAAAGANSIPNFKEIENWENDVFNPNYWIEDIVFAYQIVPIIVAVNCTFAHSPFTPAIHRDHNSKN
jgi:hypothetical protein